MLTFFANRKNIFIVYSILFCFFVLSAQGEDTSSSSTKAAPWWSALRASAPKRDATLKQLQTINFSALRRAIHFLASTYPEAYSKGPAYLDQLEAWEKRYPVLCEEVTQGYSNAISEAASLMQFQREALLANPLLDFRQILLIRRSETNLGLPQNWQGNCSLPRLGYDNEIVLLDLFDPATPVKTLYRPERKLFVGDVDLHFDGTKLLFSMLGSHNRWQIWEIGADGTGLRQVTPGIEPDVDNYDACYLPDGRIIFDSTRIFQGIPCVGGNDTVANLFIMNPDGTNIRQLCFDQDHNWYPTVLNNGRVLFTRWEYSDTPHYFTRLLFHMNPDGTGQMEYYGSNSYWPNSMFYARPIPGHPTKVVTIVSGHHGVPRMGELVILDPARGRHEADGAVQRIPGYGQPVEPVIVDHLVDNVWPKFLHPWPLSEAFFLVSCKPTPEKPWGLYLVDIFDNILLLHEEPGYAFFEPIPFAPRPTPPIIPDRVNVEKDHALVYLLDVYEGPGLHNVPRGSVKALRLYSFHYAYQRMGGHEHVGVEGPWDVRRILGTVPVAADGSVYFRVPANTPIAVQPLDAEGKALQVMRSWFTAMPGEFLSCVGCHEPQNTAPILQPREVANRKPVDITPWYGPARGFSFRHEIQPVLDRHCVGCHNGSEDTKGRPDFSDNPLPGWNNFTPSYLALHPYVRRPGPESDYHLPIPLEWHADTSELIQMLRKGHHGVELTPEAWDRLITWIDLNVPDHGRWSDHAPIPPGQAERRSLMRAQFACLPNDPSEEPLMPADYPRTFIMPPEPERTIQVPFIENWPFDSETAVELQRRADHGTTRRTIDLGAGVTMEFVLIPAGTFAMGGDQYADELPITGVTIETPFWMSVTEVTNVQYRRFNPRHDSRYIDQHHKDHTKPGYPANLPNQPVTRVSWYDAVAFTQWLSTQLQEECGLPTEAQWEWACRAGSSEALFFGSLDTDFSPFANLADYSIRLLAVSGVDPKPIPNPNHYQDFLPKDARFNDGERIVCDVGKYNANPWGLKDMHGNVSEWTATAYRPYPYRENDGRNAPNVDEKRVVRGGSWMDRPNRARAAFRLAYYPWQGVYNVGFRVIIHCNPSGAESPPEIALHTP